MPRILEQLIPFAEGALAVVLLVLIVVVRVARQATKDFGDAAVRGAPERLALSVGRWVARL